MGPVTLNGTCYIGTYYIEHTLNQFKQLGLGHQGAIKLARKLHAHSVIYANKLVTTRCAVKHNHTSHSQVLEPMRCERAVDACFNFLCAILDLTATISVSTCPPVRDFEHEGWTILVRGEALARFESRHVGV
eukprot:1156808-Pelagomonas_calceolata.AAC.1